MRLALAIFLIIIFSVVIGPKNIKEEKEENKNENKLPHLLHRRVSRGKGRG